MHVVPFFSNNCSFGPRLCVSETPSSGIFSIVHLADWLGFGFIC